MSKRRRSAGDGEAILKPLIDTNVMKKELTRKSKFMTLVLRHDPSVAGISLDENGWVSIGDLLDGAKSKGVAISREELVEIVETNEKKRFAISDCETRIRANQGHSLEVELNLREASPPPELFHGTAEKYLDSIRREGLKKMKRHHVHLSPDKETAKRVGMRHGRPVVLSIDSKRMENESFQFFISENEVWLVDSVPPPYISEI